MARNLKRVKHWLVKGGGTEQLAAICFAAAAFRCYDMKQWMATGGASACFVVMMIASITKRRASDRARRITEIDQEASNMSNVYRLHR